MDFLLAVREENYSLCRYYREKHIGPELGVLGKRSCTQQNNGNLGGTNV